MLNTLHAISLKAFFTALSNLETDLPPELQQEINQAGEIWSYNPEQAANDLIKLSENPVLKDIYEKARLEIQSNYVLQERNKFRNLDQETKTSATDPEMLENFAMAISEVEKITAIAAPILQADNSQKKAQEYKLEFKLSLHRAN